MGIGEWKARERGVRDGKMRRGEEREERWNVLVNSQSSYRRKRVELMAL